MPKTFAEYLIDKILPSDLPITKQMDGSYMKKILTEVGRKHPDQYDQVVSDLKKLADRLSTFETSTMGLAEISVPNKEKRDEIVNKWSKIIEKARKEGNEDEMYDGMANLQNDLAKNDLDGSTDEASIMVTSSMGGKKTQLMKLRSSPGVVGDHNGNVVPIVFKKSYAEGVDPLHFWLGATESRKNIAQGQVNTSKPGEIGKIIGNVVAGAVVSCEDCGTQGGISLKVSDEDVINRFLAVGTDNLPRNTLITEDIQQKLLKSGVESVLVRSPQTCKARGGTLCQKCMGLRNATGKIYEIGDNAGLIAQGPIIEPLNQSCLSSKHSATKARRVIGLEGEKGFRQFVESPKNYTNKKILCEVFGIVYRVHIAPQGGKIVTIRKTRPVPSRYVENAMTTPNMKGYVDYHIPPNLRVLDEIEEGTEVYPSMPLSDGNDNLSDIARLRNLGALRTAASQGMYNIFKNSVAKVDRRHFELIARSAHRYVQVIHCPPNPHFSQGETIEYDELQRFVSSLPKINVSVAQSLGKVLAEDILDLTVGTEVDSVTQKYLEDHKISTIQVVNGLEVAAVMTPLSRVVNKQEDWIAALAHRNLKTQIEEAAATGKKTNIHGYNPISAYAYGAEFNQSAGGRY